MRRRQQRRQRTRRVLFLSVAAVIILAVAVGLYLLGSGIQGPNSDLIGKPVPASLASSLSSLANGPFGARNSSYVTQFKAQTGFPLTSGNLPIVLYIGAEYCPYCAQQRWPLMLALMRFGNFSGLSYTESSSTDVYANTATFSFRTAAYRAATSYSSILNIRIAQVLPFRQSRTTTQRFGTSLGEEYHLSTSGASGWSPAAVSFRPT
jgi:hypothetical protein